MSADDGTRAAVTSAAPRPSARDRITSLVATDGIAVGVALVVSLVVFSAASPYFLTGENVRNMLIESVFIVLLAAGLTYVLVVGGIDLSVGSVCGLSAGVTLYVLMDGHSLVVGIAAGVATGTLVGLVNGLLIALLGISDFIVTLATLAIAAGLLQVLTTRHQLTGTESEAFAWLTKGEVAGVPAPVLITAGAVALLEFVLLATTFGRRLFASGVNASSAQLAGVPVRRLRLQVYVLCGTVAGGAGVLLASHLNSVQPGLGSGYELTAIAAAVLGGVSLAGGRGSVWRSVVGALFLSTLSQGLQLLGVDPLWFAIVTGASIVVAVAFDRAVQRLVARELVARQRRLSTAPVPSTTGR